MEVVMNAMPPVREMQHALETKDPSYDGIFFLGVRTTGIFCRPSCPARKPLSQNIEYFANSREATFAGYRPCKRCRPLDTNGKAPEWVERLISEVEKDPSRKLRDSNLREMQIDPARARRYFLKNYGMTFQAYCRGRRLGRAFEEIREGSKLDHVILDHGFESHSGFRDAFQRTFGQTPGTSRDSDCVRMTWIESPVGPLIAGSTNQGVCLLEFTDRRMLETQIAKLKRTFPSGMVPAENDFLKQLRDELGLYFEGTLKQFKVPLVYPGTPFQVRVWKELLQIPYGVTRSYEEMAHRVGSPAAVRAVGTANGMNRIAIVIPCHRVVNKSGKLGGYGGGLWRKQFLLNLEYSSEPKLF
jgi:AraC family transcriptional regulator, regulatory protein of adaptative response / methylated-DNA-[protein]-cysteine methyltransferase